MRSFGSRMRHADAATAPNCYGRGKMSPRLRGLLGLLLLTLAFAGLAWIGGLRDHTHAYLALYGVAAGGYLLALWGQAALPFPAVMVVALLLRALMFPSQPSLSDDYHRYLWDGRVQQAGINPYRYAPVDPALDAVSYPDRALINHPDVQTIYPPLSEMLFLGLSAMGLGSVAGLKLVLGAFDLATAAVIACVAGKTRRRTALTMYLLHPLVVQEIWGSAHIDAVYVFLMLTALLLIMRHRDLLAGVALGAGAAFKLVPLFLVIPAVLGGRVRPGRFLLGLTAAFLLPYLPYAAGGAFLGSLSRTDATPEFDSSIFWLLDAVLPYATARYICVGLYIAGAVWIARAIRGREHTAKAFAWTLTWATLLLPVVHPWYWLGPLALGAAAGLHLPAFLGLAAPASYVAYAQMPFSQRTWARVIAYLPLAGAWSDLKALTRELTKTKPKAAA